MSIANNFAVGYYAGRDASQRSAQGKIVEGLQEYRNILEEGGNGAIPGEDPSDRLARLQEAEGKFFEGLKGADIDMSQAGAMMQAFNSVKSQYVVGQGNEALAGWGSDFGTGALQNVLESLYPGKVTGIRWEGEDDEGRPYAIAEIAGADGEKSSATPIDYEHAQRLMVATQNDPNVLMNFDKNQLEYNEAKWKVDTLPSEEEVSAARETERRATEADTARTEAMTSAIPSEIAEREANAERIQAQTSAVPSEIAANEALAKERLAGAAEEKAKLPKSMDDVEDALIMNRAYGPLREFKEKNPQGFVNGYVKVEKALKAKTGREVTADEVLSVLEQYRAQAQGG